MNAEVIAVGSELLAGQIANTNARAISEALAGVGVDVLVHTAVGDDVGRIATALRAALGRADIVVVSGGLGPTHDDLTREGLSAATGRPLVRHPDLVRMLEERFRRMGRSMSASNLQQADVPTGAVPIDNPLGTAPGISLEHGGRLVYALPGVPDEMAAMLRDFVLPDLAARTGGVPLVTRTLRTAGIGESDLADRLAGVLARQREAGEPAVGVYASEGEVRVTLIGPGGMTGALDRLEGEVREALGTFLYGTGDETLEAVVSNLMRSGGLKLAVAESVTGGMLTSRLVGVPGASDVLVAGYVTYSPEAKIRDLDVAKETIERYGVVSPETAKAMAAGARARTLTDVAISTTGEAGPNPSETAVGTVCVGLAWDGGEAAWTFGMGGGREMIRRRTCTYALNRLRLWLLEH